MALQEVVIFIMIMCVCNFAMGEEINLEKLQKLQIEIISPKEISEIKGELGIKIQGLRHYGEMFDLEEKDICLLTAIYLAQIVRSGDALISFPYTRGETLASVSFYRMVKYFYDNNLPIKAASPNQFSTPDIPADNFKNFFDYYIAYYERRIANSAKGWKVAIPAFLPEDMQEEYKYLLDD